MTPRLPALHIPPIGFAHRGALAHAPENTLAAFELALRLGATGLESDVWLSADGKAVLDHNGFVGGRLRRTPINRLNAGELPSHMALLSDLYATCGKDFELSLDIKTPAAISEVILVARDTEAESNLWVCHHDFELLSSWRALSKTAHLVNSTRLGRIKEGPERRAASLASAGVDAINLHHSDWSGGLIALFHRFERFALGCDAQFERTMSELLDAGIDGIFSDHPDLMMDTINKFYSSGKA